jgi:heterodisulfide reductase subunit C
MSRFAEILKNDFRVQEGITACINCGVCTSVCPAAAFNNYDPRLIAETVQRGDEEEIINLLSGEEIWYCGECLSCKTRCPRGNTPAYLVQALKALSIDSGLFIKSVQGKKQLVLKRVLGNHILNQGYCVYIDGVTNEMFPEQGPVWEWFYKNRRDVLERLGASYEKDEPGVLRRIPQESLDELKSIFDVTGATERFRKLEEFSEDAKRESGMDDDAYFEYLYTGERR